MIRIEAAKAEHVAGLELRAHDALEYQIAGNIPQEAISNSIARADYAWTAFVDDSPAALWGVRQENVLMGAHIWLVTTPYVDKYCKSFVKLSREISYLCLKRFGHLYGFVDIEYEKSLRWMSWIGFIPTFDVQLNNITVRKFELRG